MKFKRSMLAMLVTASLLGGCNWFDDDDDSVSTGTPAELSILHINDHHSHLEADGLDLTIGVETGVTAGGFPRLVTKFNELQTAAEAMGRDVLKLHAGDAITGTTYYTLFKGEADAAMMNQVCFDAFALGNHEFDNGDAGLVTFLDFLNSADDCTTPALAANVVPEVGVSPLAMNSSTDYIQPYTIKEVGDQKYGIIGIDIASKTKASSNPDETTEFLDETETAQQYIDELTAMGVNKIILLTHYQFQNDLELGRSLTGVDVIVGGDSHSLLGDAFVDMGQTVAGSYPTVVENLDGDEVCVVQAWQYATILGELNVSFDKDGVVTSCEGTPHMPLAATFTREDADGEEYSPEGAELAVLEAAIDAMDELSITEEDAETAALLATFSGKVDELKLQVIGSVAQDLCLERIPGQGRSTICDASETYSNGSDISNIVSKAFLEMSNTSDICIQNGGGVRIDVPAGAISYDTAYTLLPFANTLVEVEMTGQQIIDTLEEAAIATLAGSSGAYPYASGLRWDVDMSADEGKRFSNVEINSRVAGAWTAIDTSATYKVVTNSFIAAGGDGYSTFGSIADELKTDTYLDYALSFVEYVEAEMVVGNQISKLPLDEYSTQSFINVDGVQQ